MPQPPDEPRSPSDFASILATEEPVLLVGGQAVNLWALHYFERTAELSPFVSRDIDVLGDLQTLEMLGKKAGVKPTRFPLRPPTNELGAIIAQAPDGSPLLIEVLRYVNGVTNEELQSPASTFDILGTSVRVPGPIALLQAKLANLTGLPQTGRQDRKHVRILCRLMPAYLGDMTDAVTRKGLDPRQLIERLEKLLKVVTEDRNANALRLAEIDPSRLFAELNPKAHPKLRAFIERRLPRVLGS